MENVHYVKISGGFIEVFPEGATGAVSQNMSTASGVKVGSAGGESEFTLGLSSGEQKFYGTIEDDYGIRLSSRNVAEDTGTWSSACNGSNFFDTDGKYWNNGEFISTTFTWSKPQIMVTEQLLYDDDDNQVRFTPAIGGYFVFHATNPFRPYGGEYAEVIAYNRALSLEEVKEVEVYLKAKMNQLPPLLKEAYLLFQISELSVKEIARQMNISESLVKVRIFRAKEKLKELLADLKQ